LDIGCYLIDFITSILGPEHFPAELKKSHRVSLADPQFDLQTTAILTYQNGLTAELSCNLETAGLNPWQVSGTQGSITALRYDPQGEKPVPLYLVNSKNEATRVECESAPVFKLQFENFAKAIFGQERPHISPIESIQNARLLEALSTQTAPL
jgi:predicted dehydrogenase